MSLSKIVGISGSLGRLSRTTVLVKSVLDALEDQGVVRLIELAEEAPLLFSALSRATLSGRAAEIVAAVEDADLLVIGSPVYRASYTGALKHLFDLVDHRALQGTPVLLAATGGSALHGLMPEHQLRPLFGFFNALTLPTSIYAVEDDFHDYALTSHRVHDRIGRALGEARQQLALSDTTLSHPGLRIAASA